MIIGIHGVERAAERGAMFGPLVIAYLFLGGVGAGACLVASAVGLLVPRDELSTDGGRLSVPSEYRRLLVPSLAVAASAVALGVFCLVADLGNPQAALGVLAGGATSWANFGVVALIACIVVASMQVMMLCILPGVPTTALRVLQVLGIVAGLGAAAYTGLLLMDMTGVPFWSTLWLPALFTLSALSCGLAVFVIAAVLAGIWESFSSLFDRLAVVDIVAIVLEAATLVFFLAHGAQASGEASAAVDSLLTGDLHVVFWSGVVFAGLVIPLASEGLALRLGNASPYHLSTHVLATAMFALAGAVCLRYCVVAGGAHPFLGAFATAGVAVGW